MVVGESGHSLDGSSGRVERRAAAILAIDVFGYSALMGRNEEETHLRVGSELTRIGRTIERLSGWTFSFVGDGLIAEFPEASNALQCALRVQADSARQNARLPASRRITYRIGVNWGGVVVDAARVGGTVVNVASRLERLARPGGVLVSQALYDQLPSGLRDLLTPSGSYRLKNIRDPVTAWEIPPVPTEAELPPEMVVGAEDRLDALELFDQRPSLAVLPFRTIAMPGSVAGTVDENAYFALGMVDDIIRVLGGLRHLIVVSRSATLSFGTATPDIASIGRELDVRYVLHGTVRRAGSAVRISVELADAATRQAIWADTFDGELIRLFELQDSIAIRTAGAIAPHVRKRELQRSLRKNALSVTGYDLCLRALSRLYEREPAGLIAAEALLRQASALDPEDPRPYSYLSYVFVLRLARGWARDEHAERLAAYEAARRAVMLDGSDAVALSIYAQLHGYLRKDHETALEMLDEAVAISPSCALGWSFGSLTAGILGDTATALSRAQRAVRLAPIGPEAGPWHEHALSQAHYLAEEYEQAIEWGRIAAKHGGQSSNLRCLIAALVAVGRVAEARAVAARLLESSPHFSCATFRAYTPLRGAVADVFTDRLLAAGLPS